MSQSQFSITAINAFSSNYIWVINHHSANYIALIDPGDADVCIDYIEKNNKTLTDILITHHDHDHINGINKLVEYAKLKKQPITVYGPKAQIIPHCHYKLSDGDKVHLTTFDLTFNVIETPGHTLGHIVYYHELETQRMLFCGDTLFSGGCGRIKEGTSEQLFKSLNKLATLPDNTAVYCAHEYTLANLDFALKLEPNNQALTNYFAHVTSLRQQYKNTLPSTIGLEKKVNPFLRCHLPEIKQNATQYNQQLNSTELGTFCTIREWKNHV